ncbi:MAG TPA: PDZ domain-containing protein, partial [Gemmatimonadales bacterium]|nr:PDZ domain-containing protein [Gemmatimonadales bacterium]
MNRTFVLIAVAALAATPLSAQVSARMFQEPDVSQTEIAFVYAGDIWVVPKTGGVANRLSTPPGEESFPRFSPDGSRIAFTADYDGNEDIYVVPSEGGEVRRVTHHPMPDRMVDWYPDGKDILFASSMESGRQRFDQLWRVAPSGGLPQRLPMAYGEFGAISPDGQWIAYTTKTRDFRTWKRYRGGWAPDIYLFNLKTYESKNITHSDANESLPMWHGRTLYFLSDADSNERANIWAYDLDKGSMREVTHFKDFDIHFPAIGPSDMVFEAGGRLYLMDLTTEQTHEVHVDVVTDQATLKPRQERVDKYIQAADISPTGKRAVFAARGDLFTVPAENGVVLDISRTPGAAERSPTWSPDGKWIAYWTDASGEYQLALRAADGSGEERVLTHFTSGFRNDPYWSPDSKKLVYIDQAMKVWLFDIASKHATQIDQGLYMFQGALTNFRVSWSTDSRWLTYAIDLPNRHHAIVLYDVPNGARHQVTSGFYDDASPIFDPDGKYLYLLTNQEFVPSYSGFQNTWIYGNGTKIAAVPLRADVPSPIAPKNDEEGGTADTAQKAENGKAGKNGKEAKAEASKAVTIDLEGFESRMVLLPPERGNYTDLYAAAGKVFYRRLPRTDAAEKKSPVLYWDLKERKEETVLDDANGMVLSFDGKKLLVAEKGKFAIIDARPKQKIEKPLATDQMAMTVDPPAEWHQIFNDVWRFDRDYFYDPHMHGVDWNAIRKQYGALIDDCVTRWDVNYVIGEMISELSSSHTYRGGGDLQQPERNGVGLLGVNWTVDHGAYRIAKIIDGAPWDDAVRSPLAQPGLKVTAGDYVLAVNGIPLDTAADPWAPFEGLAGKTVALTVNDRPTADGAWQVVVKTMSNESRLRNLAWVEGNRRYVDSVSGGKVGYLYIPDTGIGGQTELVREFLAQFNKDGLVVDERWNSGGQIPDRFIELLNRPLLSYYAVRDGKDWQWPPFGHIGPEVMLINGWSGSGGDAFPYYFKEAKLGPLIGMRTWG